MILILVVSREIFDLPRQKDSGSSRWRRNASAVVSGGRHGGCGQRACLRARLHLNMRRGDRQLLPPRLAGVNVLAKNIETVMK